jgi:hypothetical protein
MKGLRVLVLGLVVALACIPASRAAAAQPCPAGCGVQKNTCLKTGRIAKLACKKDCHTNAGPTALGACMRACVTTSRSAKTSCQGDHVTCLGTCTHPSPPSSCLGSCGQALGSCAHGVAAQNQICVTGCRTASDHKGCIQGCVVTAKQGAAACAAAFQSCRVNCPGSPGQAFIE